MSYNRLIYDTCAYKKELDQSTGPFRTLTPSSSDNKYRMELGIVGARRVHIQGNIVDLGNDLRGKRARRPIAR